MGINQSNPTCEVNACLNQVIGISNSNGYEQSRSCIKIYSSAQQETVTLAPINTYTSTITATASSTDVVVEIRTTEVTVYSTSTSNLEVLETVTAYTTTSVLTASTTVTAANSPALKAKKHKKRGARCKPTSTTLSAAPSTVAPEPSIVSTSSVVPPSSSAAVSASDSTSSTPESSSATVALPGPVSIAPDCPSEEAYSSACSCIWAASDATRTVTSQAFDTTILVTETGTVVVPSTSTDWTTNTVTATVLQGATTTVTSTISTGTVTTTTTTFTCPAPAPTETGELAVVGGQYNGQVLINNNNNPLVLVTGNGSKAVVARAGGQPYLADAPGVKMWITYQQSLGRVYFANVANPGTTFLAVSCSVSDANVLSCQAGNLAVDTFFTIPSNRQVYMADAAYLSTRTTPYDVVSLKVVTC